MQVEGTRLYRVRDVAGHFEVSVATIYRAIQSGQLRALQLGTGTGTLWVTGAAVLSYPESCMQVSVGAGRHDGESARAQQHRALEWGAQ